MESSHRWKRSATTTQVAGHRIKSFKPLTLDHASTSPQRLGLPQVIFNYFEDTVEIARLHITRAHCSSRKRQSRAGTLELISGGASARHSAGFYPPSDPAIGSLFFVMRRIHNS